MKTSIMILMVAGGLVIQTEAASPDSSPGSHSASTNIRQTATKHPINEFWKAKTTAPDYKVERYGRISSRPWAQTVGWTSPAQFVEQRTYEPNLNSYYRGGTSPD